MIYTTFTALSDIELLMEAANKNNPTELETELAARLAMRLGQDPPPRNVTKYKESA